MQILRAIIRFILFSSWTFLLVPFQMVYALIKGEGTQQAPIVRLWYKGVLWILNISVILDGDIKSLKEKQSLYLSNHSSYLDILILGAYLPPFFIAKADTADWPVFGFLIKIGGTFFISRKRSALPQQMKKIRDALAKGKSLFLFPEGTTSDGVRILPFKSSLLNVLYDGLPAINVTPVCLNYLTINGEPLSENNKDLAAWYGDMDFMPHLWAVFKQHGMQAKIAVLPAASSSAYPDAKSLTAAMQDKIEKSFNETFPATADKHLK